MIHFTLETRIGHLGARVDENIKFSKFFEKEAIKVVEPTEVVNDRNHYFGFGPIPKPKL